MIASRVAGVVKLSTRGQLVIPETIREQMHWDDHTRLTVSVDTEQKTITLQQVTGDDNWLEILKECPHDFELPKRDRQYYQPKNFGE